MQFAGMLDTEIMYLSQEIRIIRGSACTVLKEFSVTGC